jgi:hypothetical protein
MIAGVTKTSRSKLVEHATWEKDVGPGRMAVVTQAGRFSFSFLEKDGWTATLDKGRILQVEELTANRWKSRDQKIRKLRRSQLSNGVEER